MIKNYLKIAWRNLMRHKSYSFINISGLAIGMACSILIFLWVQSELNYDRFHQNGDRIYRLTAEASQFEVAISPAPMGAGLKQEMPGIESFTRILGPTSTLFQIDQRKFEETKGFYVDSNFLELFSFKVLRGERKKALERIDGVLISEGLAKKYFGEQNALGQIIRKDNGSNVTVVAVFENNGSNSHLQFDYLLPMASIATTNEDLKNNAWDNFNFYTYFLLSKTVDPSRSNITKLEQQINSIYKKRIADLKVTFQLQPLKDIHLRSNFQVDITGHGSIQYVKIFFIVAIFVLVVACINFMNLATARSARRAKEVGLRKVVGALRGQLIRQFLGESLLISLIALVLAVGIVLLSLPLFNNVAGKALTLRVIDFRFWLSIVAIAVGTGFLSGCYPALFLSGFKPVKVLKGNMKTMGANRIFRNGLVIVQFIVSIVLLTGTIVVYQQLKFIKNRNIGFDKQNLLYIPMKGDVWQKQDALKAELKANTLTSNFAITSDVPTDLNSGTVSVEWDGKDPNLQIVFPVLQIDQNFIDVFKMKVLEGRGFSTDFKGDSNNYVLNEEAVRVMGYKLDNVVGKPLTLWQRKGMIIGVVKNFNYKPIQQKIEPMIMKINQWGGTVVVRAGVGNTESTINALEKIYTKLNPAFPFSYNFIDQDIDRLYQDEQRLGNLFNIFAILAIFISCLGLYGLSAFMAEQRIREIGVRKVLGASIFGVVYLLSANVTRLIAIAMLIAVPLAWFAIDNWLQNFAYHIDIHWLVFFVSCLSALLIGWLTVSYESIKAAMMNPVKSLKEV
ncbi:MAG: ABC transporter permease [Chitinophagaceae bacterium]|nr:ABC transporter permease [Chitinophagaceae bacterium]